jgi:hypothetical protein
MAAVMAMRFDLVDLQLFIAVADSRSITHGALAVHPALASVRVKKTRQNRKPEPVQSSGSSR